MRGSLDTSTLMRDVKAFVVGGRGRDVPLRRSLRPRLGRADPPWPEDQADFGADVAQELSQAADELVAFDADYRSIMATAATLGMAATALLTQRIAVLVSVSSLAVAVTALALR